MATKKDGAIKIEPGPMLDAKIEKVAAPATDVIVVKAFQNGQIGNKEAGDRFPYDLKKDPLGLKKLGLVKAAPAPKPAA